MPRPTDPQDSVVTHQHQTVRRQFIDFRLPPPPKEDAEAFIIRAGGERIELGPRDFQQFIACCITAGRAAGMDL